MLFRSPEAEKTYPSKHGYEVKSDVSARDVSPERYEMIIVPGGWAPDYLRRNPDVVNMLRESYEHGAVVGAICHGGSLLCSTGILKGRQMTSFHSIKHDIMNAGAVWTDAEVVVDERLVSSRTPADLPAFVKGLADALEHQGSGR